MKISKTLVKNVVRELIGEDGVKVTNLIYKEAIAEENIAKKMNQELKQTRNILYKLQKHNLVEFKRKRNEENGWYTYFWSFNSNRINDLSKKMKGGRLERLMHLLNVEEKTQFFICENKCVRVDFDSLTEIEYTCPVCGGRMNHDDNKKKIKELKAKIKELKNEIKNS